MLKDPQTPRYTVRRTHRWRKEWEQGLHRLDAGATTGAVTPQTPTFVPIDLSTVPQPCVGVQPPTALSTPVDGIRIKC